ncbi:MAG: HlyD family efflux transporter periplasmic adaptor subunit [Synechococcaceae cyanobacterium]|nr:HlyD family efflux transporter periplasmic adaptor subunit [Synechococcaceae cyanobacterium]
MDLPPPEGHGPTPRHPGQLDLRQRRRLAWVAAAAVLVATGFGLWQRLARPVDRVLGLSGRIEGYETDLGARVGGRVLEVTVREGQRVNRGQLLVRLEDEEVQAQLRAVEARLAAARQQESQARSQIEVVDDQIREAELNLAQSRRNNEGRVVQARANVAAAEARLAEAEAELNLARVTMERTEQLMREGATSLQSLDQDRTAHARALATQKAQQRQVEAARGALELARTTGLNPSIRNAQREALLRQRERARAQLLASQAEVRAAVAARQQIQAQIAWLTVRSPLDGVVIARSVEPGAVVGGGATLLTLLDPDTVYLRGFVPEGEIGRVRVGQQARVFLDSAPQRPLAARVAEIDAEASFTPENIYFREDRVRQVFGVKLAILQPQGFAKPGMPADAEILTP